MRIATSTLYDRGLAAIDIANRQLSRTQQQLATQKRVNTASDDPVAATEILRTTSALANNSQYMANQDAADQSLKQTDSTLGQVGNLLQSVRTSMIAANNSALSDSDRNAIATEIKSRIDSLVSLANTKDGNGHFLFGGYRNDTTPFARTTTGVAYAGDDGAQMIQVSAARQMEATVSGAEIFNRITTGNGVFTTSPATSNTGSGAVDVGQVVDPTQLTGHGYQVQFSVANGATTYQVLDTTTNQLVGAPQTTGNAFTPGQSISVDGMQFTISGTPANSDNFTVAPAGRQSIFDTLKAAADLLAKPTGGSAGMARVSSGMLGAIANIDNAINHTLGIRASVGVKQNELDALTSSAQQSDTDGNSRLSDLQDVDNAKAVADMAKQKTALEAAQQTFTMISRKTLFDYM